MKENLGGTAHTILELSTARKWSAQSDTDRQNSSRDLSYIQKKLVWRETDWRPKVENLEEKTAPVLRDS